MHIKYYLLVLLLAGCTVSTPYQPKDQYGLGYDDQCVGPDLFRVSFKGMEYDFNGVRMYKFALKRASEVVSAHGFSYFEVIERKMPNQSIVIKGQFADLNCIEKDTYHKAALLVRGHHFRISPECYSVEDNFE